MHRALTVVVVLALLAGSVPAAATLADGTPSDTQPGASFSGVVGVQESEVNSEVADRSLDQRLNAAKTNGSKASVVADQSERLADRLAELEAEKEQLNRAYENGSISKGEYQARLAVLAAELRAVERQANKTATAAEELPEEALREKGANVSEVHDIARQANETGGGEVAEAARDIAGGVGNGLGNAPNASQGPPADASNDAPATTGNGTDRKPTDAGKPGEAGNGTGAPADAGNGTGAPADAGNDTGAPADAGNDTGAPADAGNGTGVPADAGNGDEPAANESNGAGSGSDEATVGAIGGDGTANHTMTDWGWNGGVNESNRSDTANRSSGADKNNSSAAAGNGSTSSNGSDESPNGSTNESGNGKERIDGPSTSQLWTGTTAETRGPSLGGAETTSRTVLG